MRGGREAQFDVSVASPCSESWQAMVGDARSRHCVHCRNTVHDLSEMTAAEIELLAMRGAAGDEMCGRVTRDAAGELVMLAVGMGARASAAPRVLLSMALAAGVPAAAQAVKTEPVAASMAPGDGFASVVGARVDVAPGSAVLTGRLVRPGGIPVDAGLVRLAGDGAGSALYVVDDKGRFELHAAPGIYQLAMQTGPEQGEEVRAVTLHEGFQSVGTVEMRAGQQDVVQAESSTMMGALVVTVSGLSWKARLRHPVLYVRSVARRLR